MTETVRPVASAVYDAAMRVIRSAHRRDGEALPPGHGMVVHVPRRPDRDDDIVLLDYLRRMEAADGHAGRYTGTFVYVCYQDGDITEEHTLGFNTWTEVESFLSQVKPGKTCNYGWLVDRHTGVVHRWKLESNGGLIEEKRHGWTECEQVPCTADNVLSYA